MIKYTEADIIKIIENSILIGKEKIKKNQAPEYSDSSVSEKFLVEILREGAAKLGYEKNIIIHHGGHAFPDVSILNSQVGIELKGSISNRKFNGNSVVASTMLPNLKHIFLLYWIGAYGDIGYRNYFDCVSTPVVTHSPRFQLDIDLDSRQSMFGMSPGKVGSVETIIFSQKGIDSNKIIKWMADKARSNGETPWWISEDESLPTGSTGLIKCTELPGNKRRAFMKSAFLAFPKIFDKSSPNKYNGLFEWAVSVKSVLSTRDDYSAGGRVSITIPKFSERQIEVPQVIQVAIEALSVQDVVYLNEIEGQHGKLFNDVEKFIIYYKNILPQYLKHIYYDVAKYDEKNVKEEGFSKLLAEFILSKIDTRTIRKIS